MPGFGRTLGFYASKFRQLWPDGAARDGLALQYVCNFSRRPGLLDSKQFKRGGLQVDLTLRLNVLAVCAAIAFVGAVLLGAF